LTTPSTHSVAHEHNTLYTSNTYSTLILTLSLLLLLLLQAEQLRRVLSETLHQTKNPLTALRTFGKLLLRRLPAADGANRELAEDIITQSDRLVDLLLPVDSIIGVLAATSSAAGAAGNGQLQQQQLLQQSELAASAELQALLQDAAAGGGLGVYDTSTAGTATAGTSSSGSQYGSSQQQQQQQQHVHYAISQHQLQLIFVQDAIEPIVRAAEAVAQAQRVSLRWRVDDDLPGVIGDERALQVSVACTLTYSYYAYCIYTAVIMRAYFVYILLL
jgi:signal transduction histidine kinase